MPMVGQGRTRWLYAFRSLIEAGAPFTLSSDWGVSTLNPFKIIETAITRQPPGKENSHPAFLPEERIGLATCVRGYTVNAAAAAWRSEDTGSLSVGKFGDLIVVDRDIFAIDPYEVGDTQVLMTLLGGRIVHRASA
jgi:predicted amidohydrolase YtcJ